MFNSILQFYERKFKILLQKYERIFCDYIIFMNEDEWNCTSQEKLTRKTFFVVLAKIISIYYLCKQNPDLAQQVTLDFTTYLRKNFTVIALNNIRQRLEIMCHGRLTIELRKYESRVLYKRHHINRYIIYTILTLIIPGMNNILVFNSPTELITKYI